MKTLKQYIIEHKGQPIDDQWINDENPVMTKDGREVKILTVDIKEVPNVIIGQVLDNGKTLNFRWNDDGTCINAEDTLGNPIRPSEDDNLVKAS